MVMNLCHDEVGLRMTRSLLGRRVTLTLHFHDLHLILMVGLEEEIVKIHCLALDIALLLGGSAEVDTVKSLLAVIVTLDDHESTIIGGGVMERITLALGICVYIVGSGQRTVRLLCQSLIEDLGEGGLHICVICILEET